MKTRLWWKPGDRLVNIISIISVIISSSISSSCMNIFIIIIVVVDTLNSAFKGVLHLLPQKVQKLACFVLYLKIINIFFEK